MKVRLFEEYSNDYYQSMTSNDFDNMTYDENANPKDELLSFTESDFNNLKNYVFNKFSEYEVEFFIRSRDAILPPSPRVVLSSRHSQRDSDDVIQLGFRLQIPDTNLRDGDAVIYRLPDEWYLIHIHSYGWFKCDQLDGLYKFIDDYDPFRKDGLLYRRCGHPSIAAYKQWNPSKSSKLKPASSCVYHKNGTKKKVIHSYRWV